MYKLKDTVIFVEKEGKMLVYDLEQEKLRELNETAIVIFRNINSSLEDLKLLISSFFEDVPNECEKDIHDCKNSLIADFFVSEND